MKGSLMSVWCRSGWYPQPRAKVSESRSNEGVRGGNWAGATAPELIKPGRVRSWLLDRDSRDLGRVGMKRTRP
jgi:hypothetical protein